jgi:hypothetical protein
MFPILEEKKKRRKGERIKERENILLLSDTGCTTFF